MSIWSKYPLSLCYNSTRKNAKYACRLGVAGLMSTLAVVPAYGTYPTIDVANIAQNTISAVENKIQSFEAVQQTVAMLEQIAQLYALYENAMNTYKSIGNAVDSIKNFRMDSLVRSWTNDFDLENFDRTLSRWGIEPSEDGALAEMNEALFGVGSAGRTIEDAAEDIRRVSRSTPRSFSRDRFIRNVIANSKEEGGGDGPTEVKGIGTFEVVEVEDTSGDPTGELRLDKQIRISEDESVMVTATESDSAALMVVSADNAIARANLDIAAQLEINRHDDETLKEWLDEASTDGDADQMELMAQNNMLVAMQNKKMGEMMDLNASLSSTQLQADRAQMELLQAIEAREKAVASAQAAMRD